MSDQAFELPRAEWPSKMGEIPDPPKQLWVRGTLPPPSHSTLTVVGSRTMTRYGQEACDMLIAGLAGYPISIISGLALGIDTCAHKAALKAGLHTLAVPGSGLGDDVLYPRSNRRFAHDIIASGGGLLSEYAPDAPSRIHYFPERNRLMVGIADAVLIIEAGQKSGTLITARLAGEYNRELLCVPHRIGDSHAFGPHLFIRMGATLVSEPLHILEALHISPRDIPEDTPPPPLEGVEKDVWDILEEPLTRDEIMRASTHPAGSLLTALVSLEMRGRVREQFGAWRRV